MTGGSYRSDCWSCGRSIPMSSRYCPRCGEVQTHEGEPAPEIRADGGTNRDDLVREAERKLRRRLEEDALRGLELRARLPEIVRESLRRILEEADDLEEARQLAGIDERGDRR